jgi:hypothetical protein
MTRAALLLVLPALAACNVQSKDPATSDGNVTINADGNGKVAFDLPFAKGEVKLPAAMMTQGDIDIDGVKLMPGSKLTGFNLNGGDEDSTVHMTFTAPQPPDEVRAYFLDQFRAKGLNAKATAEGINGTSRDGSPVVIQVSAAGNGSQVTIEARDKH